MTATRRQVLGLILSAPRPVGAYDLLAQLRSLHPKAVPPTVYRALDFLLGLGLIHRIERLSAFIGCPHVLDCHETGCCAPTAAPETGAARNWQGHRAQFLICRVCGQVQELEQEIVSNLLLQSARGQGFVAESATVEIVGLCGTCAAQQGQPVP